jgi:UDP-glucose 4-epimerase
VRLLVVGGAGYVGSVVVSQLCDAGHDVTVCDNLSTGNAWAVLPDARFVPADITDEESLELVMGNGYEAVLHFAGLSEADDSIRHPLPYLRANLVGSLNLLELMRARGVRRLVYSSSAAVYGDGWHVGVVEAAPLQPATPYADSKLAVERAIGYQAAATDLGAVTLRLFNVAGACGQLGEWHHPEAHLIPAALHVAAGVRDTVPVYGTDYGTPDGTAIRDYVHVADVARAHVLALETTAEPGHRIYNIGTGHGYSVQEVLEVARSVTGHPIPSVGGRRRDGDAPALVASTARARTELGFMAERPGLVTMIDDAWSFMRAHLGSRTSAGFGAIA